MFTGIVEETGKVKAVIKASKSFHLSITAQKVLQGIRLGDSIAVNGVCLTVAGCTEECFTADVMPETLKSTTINFLKKGEIVNLERALQVGGRFGGHIVSGHIDGVGTIQAKEKKTNAILLRVQTTAKIMKYIVQKGSIAVDGISLTVVDLGGDWFVISIIPHTAQATTLGTKELGAQINLETDIMGKYVEKLLGSPIEKQAASTLNMDVLKKYGFR